MRPKGEILSKTHMGLLRVRFPVRLEAGWRPRYAVALIQSSSVNAQIRPKYLRANQRTPQQVFALLVAVTGMEGFEALDKENETSSQTPFLFSCFCIKSRNFSSFGSDVI